MQKIPSITLFLCAFCAFLWLINPFNQRNPRLNISSCSSYLRGEKIREISVNPWLINDLRRCKALYICRDSSTGIESSLQIKLFMQNKAKFRKVKLNVNKVLTKDYEKKTLGERGKKQSQTNPNKPKFKKAKMNITSYITKGYENKTPIRAPKKQSQISKRQKTMQTSLPKRIMKITAFSGSDKTNPIQSQTKPIKANFRGKKMLLRLTQCILSPAVFVCLKTENENIILSKRLVYDMRGCWRYRECRT